MELHFAPQHSVALHPTSTDRKTSRAALQLLRIFSKHLSCAFALGFAVCVCVCVFVCPCAYADMYDEILLSTSACVASASAWFSSLCINRRVCVKHREDGSGMGFVEPSSVPSTWALRMGPL